MLDTSAIDYDGLFREAVRLHRANHDRSEAARLTEDDRVRAIEARSQRVLDALLHRGGRIPADELEFVSRLAASFVEGDVSLQREFRSRPSPPHDGLGHIRESLRVAVHRLSEEEAPCIERRLQRIDPGHDPREFLLTLRHRICLLYATGDRHWATIAEDAGHLLSKLAADHNEGRCRAWARRLATRSTKENERSVVLILARWMLEERRRLVVRRATARQVEQRTLCGIADLRSRELILATAIAEVIGRLLDSADDPCWEAILALYVAWDQQIALRGRRRGEISELFKRRGEFEDDELERVLLDQATVPASDPPIPWMGDSLLEPPSIDRSMAIEDEGEDSPTLLDRSDPVVSARVFLAVEAVWCGSRVLLYMAGAWWWWSGGWRVVEDEAVRKRIRGFLAQSKRLVKDELVPFAPRVRDVNEVERALQSLVFSPGATVRPSWLGPEDEDAEWQHILDPRGLIVCANGMVDVDSGLRFCPTPRLLSSICVPAAYDPEAPPPRVFLSMLEVQMPDDPTTMNALLEYLGLCLVADTSFQRFALLIGVRSSSKSTLMTIMKWLLGATMGAMTLAEFGLRFGLQGARDKALIVFPDARLDSRRMDADLMLQRILAIVGEDEVHVDTKFKDPLSMKLSCRIIIHANEVPLIEDNAGALERRLLAFRFPVSHMGREDPDLASKLRDELPGILRLLVTSLHRLRERGHFAISEAMLRTIDQVIAHASPMRAFVRSCLAVGPDHRSTLDELYDAYRGWCIATGRDPGRDPGARASFARALNAAVPSIQISHPRHKNKRTTTYSGVALRMERGKDQ